MGDNSLAYCLNPRGGHENPDTAISCSRCGFLVHGAHIGTYQVLSFIGAGSYGYVYKIRESAPLSRVLALKVLRLDQFTAKSRANFFQEARRIAAMHHPNILPVYNFGQLEDSEQPYLVTDYAPRTILDLFRNSNGAPRLAFAEELVPYVQQTADALQYVHNSGMVHQDVKPGNLLIGRNGQVLLSDFGTTLHLGTQTHASLGEVTGTAAYMPPEQWQGTPRRDSDQYALAICCYELLTGRTPFVHKGIEEMWLAHVHTAPPPPQQWNPRIPVEVSAVLQRAMAKDYRQRYSSVSLFARAYTEAVETALLRYVCRHCGQQNRSGAQRCAFCGTEYDNRRCPYCETPVRFGQRCCSTCGRLTIPSALALYSPLAGVSLNQGRYIIKHMLRRSEESRSMVAIAFDERTRQKVILKRWECADTPLAQRAKDVAHFDRVTEPLTRLQHPLVPRVLQRFAEGQHYYLVMNYIDGESIEERLLKLLRPIPEQDAIQYMFSILNILIALEKQTPPLRHYDISPSNIIIEKQRNRAMLTGFQVPLPPSILAAHPGGGPRRTTRKLAISPYLPIQDKPFDQRTCIFALAATMHHAVTNIAPPHYPTYPPARILNKAISPAFEAILSKALAEDPGVRYQTYEQLKASLQALVTKR
ncbi:protein kinase domain-containing protein [Thermosporothrix hazakensis]|uniref:protein kinase domain-containing protein n=1 Tax=Thermosporothrix hazakensis TaxID=644383 RepID=UPI000DAB78E3|nr:protein kinase [Thermosporothrix hazakensis]